MRGIMKDNVLAAHISYRTCQNISQRLSEEVSMLSRGNENIKICGSLPMRWVLRVDERLHQ